MGYPFAQKRPPVPQLLVFDKPAALQIPKSGIVAVCRKQLLMRAHFDNLAMIHDDQSIQPGNGTQAVCNGNDGFSVHQVQHLRLNRCLDFAIQRAGGFIQNQDRCIFQDDTGEGNPLALTTAEFDTAFTDLGVKANVAVMVFQIWDEAIGLGLANGLPQLVLTGVGPSVQNVFANAAVKQAVCLVSPWQFDAEGCLD